MEKISSIMNKVINTMILRAIEQGIAFHDVYYIIYGAEADENAIDCIMSDDRLTTETKTRILKIK